MSRKKNQTDSIPCLLRVVSGGQTGVDRTALDVAIFLGISHGGWCPQDRRAEDGPIAPQYALTETSAAGYAARTERNVTDSDGTLIIHGGKISGGTALTITFAKRLRRPLMIVSLADEPPGAHEIRSWIQATNIGVLNVAGPRESSCPGIGKRTEKLLYEVFSGLTGESGQ